MRECVGATQAHSQAGMLDEVAERVLAILGDQLFGVVAEEKEVAAVAGALREAKRTRSYDSYEVLARCTTLRTHLAMLLGLVSGLSGTLSRAAFQHHSLLWAGSRTMMRSRTIG